MSKKSKKYRKPIRIPSTESADLKRKTSSLFTPISDPYKWGVLCLLFIVGIIGYFSSFSNGFIWDDTMLITPNEYIRQWRYLPNIFMTDIHHFGLDQSNFYRPLQAVSYMLDYSFWELNPMGYHLSSTIIHVINAFLVYLLIFNVTDGLDMKVTQYKREIALSTALIWMLHPIHTQVVTYAAGRADELVAMFVLATLYAFMALKPIWISAVLFVLALLCKEFAIITPLFILTFHCFGLTIHRNSWHRNLMPFIIISAVYIVLRLTVLNFPTDFNTELIPGLYQRLLTSSLAVSILTGLLFFPFDLSMDRNIDWQDNILNIKVLLSIASIMLILAIAFLTRKRMKGVIFGIIWSVIGYLLVANFIPMNANVSEHWMYIPSIGIWFAVFYLVFKLIGNINLKLYYSLVCILCIYFAAVLIHRNADFKNEITFYNQILERKYHNPRVHYNLGCAYFFAGEEEKSYKHLLEAIKLNPNYAAAYGNLGQLEYRKGNVDKAIQLYEKANSLKANLVENRANLGMAYVAKKNYSKAIEQLDYALQLNPRHVAALNNMGIAYGTKGDYHKAKKYFEFALSINPTDSSTKSNLARLHKLMQKSDSN